MSTPSSWIAFLVQRVGTVLGGLLIVVAGTGTLMAADGSSAPSTPSAKAKVGDSVTTSICFNQTPAPACCYGNPCQANNCPQGSISTTGSLIDNTDLDYQHDATDFAAASGGAASGCASCGGSAANAGDVESMARMPSLTITRIHRPLDPDQHSSFGPGVFWEYDCTFQLSQRNGAWSGSLFMPRQHRALTFQQNGLSFQDGAYNSFHDITLFGADALPTALPNAAATAVLTTWEGTTYTFELVAALNAGRLERMADRHGNALTIAYQFSATAAVADPSLLWEMSTVTDAYGRQASFTYAPNPLAGYYPVTGITVPGGEHLVYQYSDPSLLGLSSVQRPDGTASWFTSFSDAVSQCQVYSFFDASALPLERRRDVYLTLGQWVDPTNPGTVSAISPNHVRMVVNGAGEVSYLTWNVITPSAYQQEYVYEGGQSLFRFTSLVAFPVSMERALSWDLATDPSTWSWELAAGFRTDADKWTTMTADGLGRTTQTPFDIATATRPSITYPDGTTVSTTWNQFREPLQIVDALGRITQNTYDDHGDLLSRTVGVGSADQATTTWTYNGRGQPVTMTDANGHTTVYQYSTAGDLAAVIEPPDVPTGTPATWSYAYDAVGNRIAVTDPVGRLVTTAYDACNRPVLVSYMDGSTESTTWGGSVNANLRLSATDRNGNLTTYLYDGQGRETTCTVATGTAVQDTTTTTYLPGTNLVDSQVTWGDSVVTTYDYRNRAVASTTHPTLLTALSESTRVDAADQVVIATDPYGRRTERAFDPRGRVLRTAQELVPGSLASDQELIDALPAPSESPWTVQDLGNPTTPGSLSINGGAISITDSGIEMWSDTEQFTLYDQDLDGDGSITCRIVSQDSTDPWAKAGLMMRSADAVGAAYAALFTSPGHGVSVNDRAASGLDTTYQTLSASHPTPPECWLRLERSGSDIRSYTSPDGVTWSLGNETTVGFGVAVRVGLFVLAHETTTPGTAVFDNVTVEQASTESEAILLALTQGYVAGLDRASLSDVIITDTSYDADSEPIAAIDGRGIITTAVFDPQGRMIQQTQAAGTADAATTTTGYDPVGNVVALTDPLGRLSSRLYSARNLLLDQTNAVGLPEALTITHTYTLTKRIASTTTPLGTTLFTYGICCDRLVGMTDEAGFQTTATYDAVGNRTSLTDGNGLTTLWSYDARNRTASTTDGAGERTIYCYDDHVNDGQGLDASYGVYLSDLPLGPGADGSAVLTTDPLGHTTLQVFDGLHRVMRVLDPLHHATTTSYDRVVDGLVDTTLTDAVGDSIHRRSDGHGRVRQVVDALGKITSWVFDGDDNALALRDPNGVGDDWQYDARNRRVLQTDTVGAVTIDAYDLVGNLLSEQDALGAVTSHGYDGLNRRIRTTDRIGTTTLFSFDALGNLLSITDAQGGVTAYAYDSRSLLIRDAFPGTAGGVRTYTYDGGRRLTSRTDQKGVVTTYGYDPANRLITRGYPDHANDSFTYDQASRLTQAQSGRYANTVQRVYDAANRLTDEGLVVVADPLRQTTVRYDVFYGYDNANRMTLLAYPDGTQSQRTYTARNELATVTYAQAPVTSRSYDAGGRLVSSVAGNGLTETRTYRLDNLVQTISVPGVTGFTYGYDADKRTLVETNGVLPAETQAFGYDSEGRLITWKKGAAPTPVKTQTWNLSPLGDWTQTSINAVVQTRTHNAVHEITAINQQPVLSDPTGNLVQDPLASLTLGWDPENRLSQAVHQGVEATYSYDALGRRAQRTVGDLTTTFVSAGPQVVWETDTDQAVYEQDQANGGAPTPQRPLGGVMSGTDITRIAFLPDAATTPAGFQADHGSTLGVHGNGLTYGWAGGPQPYTHEYNVLPLPPFNGNDDMQEAGQATGTWEIQLPNGAYPVVVVMGDAENRDMTNDITIGGVPCTDPAPDSPQEESTYEQGRFVGYAVKAVVNHGLLQIVPRSTAVHARICFLEIGPHGGSIDPATTARLASLVQSMTRATAGTPPKLAIRAFVYGAFVDEVLETKQTTTGVHGSSVPYFFHANRLYSVASLTNAAKLVVERYQYRAYGERRVMDGSGSPVNASAYGNQYGFTGRYHDAETGLVYMRARMMSTTLGRFLERDPWQSSRTAAREGYHDGYNLYAGYLVPNGLDPRGLYKLEGDTLADIYPKLHEHGGETTLDGTAKYVPVGNTECKQEDGYECPTCSKIWKCTQKGKLDLSDLKSTIDLPEWTPGDKASDNDKAVWTTYMAKLTEHEKGHEKIDNDLITAWNGKEFTGEGLSCDKKVAYKSAGDDFDRQGLALIDAFYAADKAANDAYHTKVGTGPVLINRDGSFRVE